MSDRLELKAEWELLNHGSPEDRATFAAIGIRFEEIWLTEADDAFVNRVRRKVPLSGYLLAEWLAWNWWRLRWEPRRHSVDWAMAHRLATVGGGYVWPNITIISDGDRIILNAEPTEQRPEEPLRYIAEYAAVVRASEFESTLDSFMGQVIGKLRLENLAATNLDAVWSNVSEERGNSQIAQRRKFEALLGHDPDESNPEVIDRLVNESKELGEDAVEELAADTDRSPPVTAEQIRGWASSSGADAKPRDAVRLTDRSEKALPTNVTAWKRGASAARALRDQLALDGKPISNDDLCDFLGVSKSIVMNRGRAAPLSFFLSENVNAAKVALRSRYDVGRRFDLARLVGDRVAATSSSRLMPGTRSHTYRQKLQRSFAAEFLCPFTPLADMLQGDFSDEAMENAAERFSVSPLVVKTMLVNHRLIERDDLLAELDAVA